MNDNRINISPSNWGPKVWDAMYYIAIGYPIKANINDMNSARSFYTSLENLLPCGSCRMHYSDLLQKYPLKDQNLNSRFTLLDWIININNKINEKLNKKLVTESDIVAKYLSNNDKAYDYMGWFILFVIIVLILVIIYYLCC